MKVFQKMKKRFCLNKEKSSWQSQSQFAGIGKINCKGEKETIFVGVSV